MRRQHNMTLAELIHKALEDPKFRLALEAGTLNIPNINLPSTELRAVAQVLRYEKSKQDKGLIPEICAVWREEN